MSTESMFRKSVAGLFRIRRDSYGLLWIQLWAPAPIGAWHTGILAAGSRG